jgi:hypothetical protein
MAEARNDEPPKKKSRIMPSSIGVDGEMSLNQLLEMLPDELMGTPTLEPGLLNGVTATAAASISGFPGPSAVRSMIHGIEDQPVLGQEKKDTIINSTSGNEKGESTLLTGRLMNTPPLKEAVMAGCSPANSSPNRAVDGVAERSHLTTSCSPSIHDDGFGASPVNPASTSTVTLSPGASGEPVYNGKDSVAQSGSDGMGLDSQPQFLKEGGSDSGVSESGAGLPRNGVQLPGATTAAGKLMTVSAVSDMVQHAEQTVKVEPNPIATEQTGVRAPTEFLSENGHPMDVVTTSVSLSAASVPFNDVASAIAFQGDSKRQLIPLHDNLNPMATFAPQAAGSMQPELQPNQLVS